MRDTSSNLSPQENYLNQLYSNSMTEEFAGDLQVARASSDYFGKTGISLGLIEGRILSTLVKNHQCLKFVEVGTLTGYSALWICEGLQAGGKLWSFEKDPNHASKADSVLKSYCNKKNSVTFEVIVGDAVEKLPSIESQGPFDGIFIDGNKSAYGSYLDWAEKNLKVGGLILADNIFLGGSVCNGNTAQFSKKQIDVMKRFNERLADSRNYISTVIPTNEGLFYAIKK